jgi:hypothetical protein
VLASARPIAAHNGPVTHQEGHHMNRTMTILAILGVIAAAYLAYRFGVY